MSEFISVEDQKKLYIKGATKVKTSTSNFAVVETADSSININGSELEIVKLDLENKEVMLSGNVNQIKFSNFAPKQSFLKRIFK